MGRALEILSVEVKSTITNGGVVQVAVHVCQRRS